MGLVVVGVLCGEEVIEVVEDGVVMVFVVGGGEDGGEEVDL